MAPESRIALKEWQVVVDALAAGETIVLLRKGGIVEEHGRFRLEQPEFFLYPTYLHQSAGGLREEFRGRIEPRMVEPTRVRLPAYAVVTDILHPRVPEQVLAVEPFTLYHSSLLHMRWNYKPQNPLFLLLARVYRPTTPPEIEVTAEQAGCRSWVPLARPLATVPATPAMADDEFERVRAAIHRAVGVAQR